MPISLTLTPFYHFHPTSGLLSSQDLTYCPCLMIDCELKLVWKGRTVDSLHYGGRCFISPFVCSVNWLLPIYSMLTSNFAVMYTINGKSKVRPQNLFTGIIWEFFPNVGPPLVRHPWDQVLEKTVWSRSMGISHLDFTYLEGDPTVVCLDIQVPV